MDVLFLQLHIDFLVALGVRMQSLLVTVFIQTISHPYSPTIESVAIGHQSPAQPTRTEAIQLINA
jgi:hypothetical protein